MPANRRTILGAVRQGVVGSIVLLGALRHFPA
jgi:hypothetical protein